MAESSPRIDGSPIGILQFMIDLDHILRVVSALKTPLRLWNGILGLNLDLLVITFLRAVTILGLLILLLLLSLHLIICVPLGVHCVLILSRDLTILETSLTLVLLNDAEVTVLIYHVWITLEHSLVGVLQIHFPHV